VNRRGARGKRRRGPLPPAGFTLVEVLASLALVGLLAVAAVELTVAASRLSSARKAPLERASAARAVLLLIDDAVLAFDTVASNQPPRIEAAGDQLRMRTRTPQDGAVVRTFEWDRMRGVLRVQDIGFDTTHSSSNPNRRTFEPRIVARDVVEFDARFEPRQRVLQVRLAVAESDVERLERRYVIP
jgi:prepilin-type N-terminal cleavage/methylation domain-containing protein